MVNPESIEMQRLRMAVYAAAGSPPVCPRCSEGLPGCAHGLSHGEACGHIHWASRVCLRCDLQMAVEQVIERRLTDG